MALSIVETKKGVLFKAIIQPRSSGNMICGIHADALKIKLTAPPVDGAANRLCVKFLASVLGIPASHIEIIKGHGRRNKKIFIHSVTREYLESIISSFAKSSK
ncbi:MAG: DUF167 domain-containing protein [Desulfobacteria bacterium]